MKIDTSSMEDRALASFTDHGALPFVAREAELERLVAFWRGTAEAQGIRAALMTGESGVGKSRLLEELVPRVAAPGGVVVHAKLYQGSSTSIAPILARAIRFSGAGRSLLKREPDDDIESVIGALERLARLRPVLLVVEDIHLLSGDALHEFSLLLDALATEAISVLALARPMELSVRGVLERYLVEEIELAGLAAGDIARLWSELFRSDAEPEVIALLAELTRGNTLALRSAIRGALKSGALARDAAGVWRPMIPMPQFRDTLDRNIRLLSEGMAAHLTDEERSAAARLATIGEVFAREAGELMIAPDAILLDALLFKGILVEASSSTLPLPGTRSMSPLAFAHTLLHRHLVESAVIDADRLVSIIARGMSLYSILPYELLRDHPPRDADRDELRAWIDHSIQCALALDGTPDWELGIEIIRAVEALFEATSERWGGERDCVRMEILVAKLHLTLRDDHSSEFLSGVDRLLAMTAHDGCAGRLELRLLAFKFLVRAIWRGDYARCLEVWNDAERLLAATPSLRASDAYVEFMETMAQVAWATPDEAMLRRIDARLGEIMASEEAPRELKDRAWRSIARYFLTLYRDAAELEMRLAVIADLERKIGAHDVSLQMLKLPMLESIGRMEELRASADPLIPRLRERGMLRQYYQALVFRICIDAWFDTPMDTLIATIHRLRQEVPEPIRPRFDLSVGDRLVRQAVLRGAYKAARGVVDTFFADPDNLAPHFHIMLGAGEGRLREVLRDIIATGCDYPDLLAMARVVIEGADDARREALLEVRSMCAQPMLCTEDFVNFAALLDMIMEAELDPANAEFVDELRGDISSFLTRGCEWLAARNLFGVLEPVLERYGRYLGDRELGRWRARASEIRAAYEQREHSRSLDTRIGIVMLGTIEVHRRGEEPVRLRGARLRNVLGLMVANHMLEKPLSYREFCRLGAGGEEDHERARKMVSMALLRLRESIGSDVIISNEGETPMLDLDRVHVDLIDAHRMLGEALRSARRGNLARALSLLIDAFALTRSEVPFPTLYDDFFEAMREDFDFTIREGVIQIGGGLLREGDPVGAEEALRRGFEAMPEDEEIIAMLCQALEGEGKRSEAERIRLRIAELT